MAWLLTWQCAVLTWHGRGLCLDWILTGCWLLPPKSHPPTPRPLVPHLPTHPPASFCRHIPLARLQAARPHPSHLSLTMPSLPFPASPIADTFHKPGFKLQARILHHLFAIVQVGGRWMVCVGGDEGAVK